MNGSFLNGVSTSNGSFLVYNTDGKKYKIDRRNNLWCQLCSINNCYNFISKNFLYCVKHVPNIIKVSSIGKGNRIELYIFNLLQQLNDLTNIKIIGQENCKLDIIFQIKSEINNNSYMRGIQVKQLSKVNEDTYKIIGLEKYDNDTLIVAVSEDLFFHLIFMKKYLGDRNSISINIRNIDTLIRQFFFFGILDNTYGYNFIELINKLCKESTIYNELCFSIDCLKEKYMTYYLEQYCKFNNLSFYPNVTSNSSIDCTINGFNCQLKFSSRVDSNMFLYSMCKRLDNKNNIPYSINDGIHFLI